MTCFLINIQPPSSLRSPPLAVLEDSLGWGAQSHRAGSASYGGSGKRQSPVATPLHTPQIFSQPALGRAGPGDAPDVASGLGDPAAQGGQTRRHLSPQGQALWEKYLRNRARNNQRGPEAPGRCL